MSLSLFKIKYWVPKKVTLWNYGTWNSRHFHKSFSFSFLKQGICFITIWWLCYIYEDIESLDQSKSYTFLERIVYLSFFPFYFSQVLVMYSALPDPNMLTMTEIINKAVDLVSIIYVSVSFLRSSLVIYLQHRSTDVGLSLSINWICGYNKRCNHFENHCLGL